MPNEDDPVILQWYTIDKKRHVRVVPRKIAAKAVTQFPGATHVWEMQKGLKGFAKLMIAKT